MILALIVLVAQSQSLADAAFERARAAHTSGRLAEAETLYRDYERKFGPRAEVLANLGAVLAQREDFSNAIQAYQRALKLNPSLVPLHLNLGLAHFKQGQSANAIAEFDAFLAAQPDHRQGRQLRAMALMELERYAESEQQYRSLLPGDLSISLGLALSLLRQQKGAEARAILDPLFESNDSPELQFTLGQALLEDGQIDDALAAFERVRKMKPDLPLLRLNIGGAYWRQRKTVQALDEWRQEYTANPRSFSAVYTLGAALALSEKDRPQAEQYLRQAVALRPRNARASYQLAKLLWAKQSAQEAGKLLATATTEDPKFREAFVLYGAVLRAQGRAAESAKAFARAKELSQQELSRQRDLFLEGQ